MKITESSRRAITTRHIGIALILLPTLCLISSHRANAQGFVTVGTGSLGTSGTNVFPFGATTNPVSDYAAGGEYQQLYSQSSFSGLVDINSISFASASLSSPTTVTYNVTIGLSTTSIQASSLNTNFKANEGSNFKSVYSGTMTANLLANNTFDLLFPTAPFLYDPSQGNLLLDVVVNSAAQSTGNATFLQNNLNQTARVYQQYGQGTVEVDPNYGLYTRFGVSAATSAVPEPAPLWFLTVGFLALALFRMNARRQLKTARVLPNEQK